MTTRSWIKDPDAVLDYTADFRDWLGTDTIASVDVEAFGVTVDTFTATLQAVTVWVRGGVIGTPARVRVRIVTAAGRTDDRTMAFVIQAR